MPKSTATQKTNQPKALKKKKRAPSKVVKERSHDIFALLTDIYPEATCSLDYETPVQLLIATILSAQCTDERVNKVTPALFARFPDAISVAGCDREELEQLVRSTGFYRNKCLSNDYG